MKERYWWALARAVGRGDFGDLGMCHNCYAIVPADPDEPEPCSKCGYFDIDDWELVEGAVERGGYPGNLP